jgi:hypothetical protein
MKLIYRAQIIDSSHCFPTEAPKTQALNWRYHFPAQTQASSYLPAVPVSRPLGLNWRYQLAARLPRSAEKF